MPGLEIIAAHKATQAVTEMEQRDPRPAALVDTVWDRLNRRDLGNSEAFLLFEQICIAVLHHYGYPLRGVDIAVIPAAVRSAVRMARIPESHGCRHCGVVVEDHGERVSGFPGRHEWTPATEEQQDLRLRALITQEELEAMR